MDAPNYELQYTDEKLMVEIGLNKKHKITQFIKKHFVKDIHYQEINVGLNDKDVDKQHGGHNKKNLILTQETYGLVRDSYGLKNRYVSNVKNMVRTILPLETQTIGFIEKCFCGILRMTREKVFGRYRVDLFIDDHNIVVECDEFGHSDRCPVGEKTREDYLKSQGLRLVRFNPNSDEFDMSHVIREITSIILKLS